MKTCRNPILLASLAAFLSVQTNSFAQSAPTGIPFTYVKHIMIVPVTVGERNTYFVLDTGAGVNVISQSLADKMGCKSLGKVTGKRMSGQKVTMNQKSVSAFKVGSCRPRNIPMATWKLEDVFAGSPELATVEGLVSLEYFKKSPFTIDYGKQTIYVEDDQSLKLRSAAGVSIPIQLVSGKNQTSVVMPLYFSNGSLARVEVDTGSGALILDTKYLREFGVDVHSMDVKTVKGTDETGYPYVRYFTKLPLDAFLATARQFTQKKPKVQFQKIIYDGLVGDDFLRNSTVTFDLPHKRMIFAPPSVVPQL